jgi:alkanesulfonate monooxygenase
VIGMSVRLHWFLPTSDDGRGITGRAHPIPAGGQAGAPGQARAPGQQASGGPPTQGAAWVKRPPDIEYLVQVARAAELAGFEGVLTPTGVWCEDAWLITAALTRETRRLRFIVAFRPGFLSPTLAAHMAGTFQRLSGGRLVLNIVNGGQDDEQRRFGDLLPHDERYARCAEFLTVVRGAWSGRPFDFAGDYYRVEGASVFAPPDPRPDIYFGGSSPAAGEVAARHADVYLTWGEPPAQVAEKIDWIRRLAKEQGRDVRFGIRLHAITRDTARDAWAEAARMLANLDPDEVETAQRALAASGSVGQRRQRELHERYRASGDARDLEIHPNLWVGVGLVRGGSGAALVGSHQQVADLIEEYAALGVEEFIMSGYPHLEEAYWFGEGVLPELRRRGQLSRED